MSFASALVESCSALRRLRLNGFRVLDSNRLLRIARGCSQLEYFELSASDQDLAEIIVEFMQALPHLHTLSANVIRGEADWLEIAVRGLAPSLRILDDYTEFTCTGFRQFSAACPHLAGINLSIINMDIGHDYKSLFEHCAEMKHLVLSVYGEPGEVVDAALESVALCCPNLEILNLNVHRQWSTWALQLVLDSCSHLNYLSYRGNEELVVPPSVIVSGRGLRLAKWMPAAD